MGTGLRIIGGSLKGRRLVAPPGVHTRPTGARVREAIFNIMAPMLPDAVVLDLFSGSGALALEAVSRGARRAVCVDNSHAAVTAVQQNIDTCRVNAVVRIIQWDARRDLHCLNPDTDRFHLVFMDPPYAEGLVPTALTHLVSAGVLHGGARIVVEHDAREPMVDVPAGLVRYDRRAYGKTLVSFLEFMI